MECFMSCCIRIRACSKPADFFDEIIPEEGLQLNGWRFTRHQIPDIMTTAEGLDVEVVGRWLYAETDCEPEQWRTTLRDKRPALTQSLQVLAAVRQARLNEALSFTMWYEEYEHNGACGNIEPYRINVSVGIQNFKTIASDGTVLFDARIAQEEHARQQALEARKAAKAEVQKIAKYIMFLEHPFFRRAWESYRLALGDDDHAMSHMYDLRDAANKGVGGAQKKLGVSINDWSRFGLILNNQAIQGGRHNGLHTDPIRPLTEEERSFLLTFGEELLFAFGDFLELEEKAKLEKAEREKSEQETDGQTQADQNSSPKA